MFLWLCFLWWCFCGGVFVVVYLCGVFVVVRWRFCGGVVNSSSNNIKIIVAMVFMVVVGVAWVDLFSF